MNEPWTVDLEDVPRLIEAILSPERTHSLIMVSPSGDTGRPRINVKELMAKVRDLPTDVVLLKSMEVSERLSDSINSTFHCYGGSVRVVMPDARVIDHFRRHPLILIYPEDDPTVSLRRIVDAAERTPVAVPLPPPPPPTPRITYTGPRPKPAPPPGRTARPFTPADSPAPAPSTTTPPAPPAPSPAQVVPPVQTPTPAHTPFGLADIEAVVTRSISRVLEEQLGGPGSETERERSRADTAEEALQEANNRIRRLEDELHELRASQRLPRVFADPVAQLRWEVEWVWLTTTPESERSDRGLPEWTMSEDFPECLQTQVVPRGKTLEVMSAVLRGNVWDQYETHQFLEGKSGKARISPDGTPIMRTYVKAETPQAPRLTWWQTPKGGYHFEHVGAHDELL